jgi:hypothetical protein
MKIDYNKQMTSAASRKQRTYTGNGQLLPKGAEYGRNMPMHSRGNPPRAGKKMPVKRGASYGY